MFELKSYWTQRAPTYSQVNQEELDGIQHKTWSEFLDREIRSHFGINISADKSVLGNPRNSIKVLDIGSGPGFLAIILAELGYDVTSSDFTEAMLEKAKMNAGSLAKKIHFVQDDAHTLSAQNGKFDVILSRNLFWNLPKPEEAYKSIFRTLNENGLMMIFDANWYAYLFDETKKAAYEQDRQNVATAKCGDYNIGENFDKMEEMALKLPLSSTHRPNWDINFLESIGMKNVEVIEDVGKELYSEKEKLNYASTPMFFVRGVKETA